jgi:large subunit ribosomal protein L17
MRHQKKTVKLGRKSAHRDALLANQVCSLIEHKRIKTTLAKAKAVRPLAEKMVTLGKRGDLHARRLAISYLRQPSTVKVLFEKVAPAAADRKGGYTRIIKLGPRQSDSSPMAYLEWVDLTVVTEEEAPVEAAAEPTKAKKEPKAKKADAPTTEKAAKAPKAKKAEESPEAPASEASEK